MSVPVNNCSKSNINSLESLPLPPSLPHSPDNASKYYLDDEVITNIQKQVDAQDISGLQCVFQIFTNVENKDHPFLRDCPDRCWRLINMTDKYSFNSLESVTSETIEKEGAEDGTRLTRALIKKVMVQFIKFEVLTKVKLDEDVTVIGKNGASINFNSKILKFSNDYFYSMFSTGMQESIKQDGKYKIDYSDQYSEITLGIVKNFFYESKITPIPSLEIARELYDFGNMTMEQALIEASTRYFYNWSVRIGTRQDLEIYIDIMEQSPDEYKKYFSSPLKVVDLFLTEQNINHLLSRRKDGIILHVDHLNLFKKVEQKVEAYVFEMFKGFFINDSKDFEKVEFLCFMDKKIRDKVTEISIPEDLTGKQVGTIKKIFPNINFVKLKINFYTIFEAILGRVRGDTWNQYSVTNGDLQSCKDSFFTNLLNYKEFKVVNMDVIGRNGLENNYLIVNSKFLNLLPQLPIIRFSIPIRIGLESISFFQDQFETSIDRVLLTMSQLFTTGLVVIRESGFNRNHTIVSTYLECHPIRYVEYRPN